MYLYIEHVYTIHIIEILEIEIIVKVIVLYNKEYLYFDIL